MTRTNKYVGLDVHQATTVIAVQDERGRVVARSVVPTATDALVDFVRGMRGPIRVAFEEGTQAQWLHDLLRPLVAEVVVCNRRGDVQLGNKGDHADAEQLAERLRRGGLRAVYHGSPSNPSRDTLKELARAYQNVLEDRTRTMQRLKAVFRARGIRTPGRTVYHPAARTTWLAHLPQPGARLRAEALYAELEMLEQWRRTIRLALLAEAKRDPAWGVLRTIPFLGPIRVALVLATLQTPWRFRTKRQLWAYAGLAVVTRASAEYDLAEGRPPRRRRPPLTRGLNRNHHPVVKNVLKGAATAAATRPGPLRDFYEGMVQRGMRTELARVTLTRKLAAILLHLWKTGERYDPAHLLSTTHFRTH
jgi:transposase